MIIVSDGNIFLARSTREITLHVLEEPRLVPQPDPVEL
jgi:hypothetical protein